MSSTVKDSDIAYNEIEPLPVIIARGASSLGSLSATRAPGLIPIFSTSELETSRLMGIGKRVPSARRKVSTTL